MNTEHLLAYLKSGGWGGYQPAKADEPIALASKTFGSQYAARQYIRNIVSFCPPGQQFSADDALMLVELVKSWPGYKTIIEPFGIRGFTVKSHPAANGQFVKILVVLLARRDPHGGHNALFGNYVQVSIDRCFENIEVKHVTRNVVRQDDCDVDEAA